MMDDRKIIIPFNRQEVASLKEAAEIAGRCVETMRLWAEEGIGRKIGGRWAISRPALLMWLEGNTAALSAYWSGDRTSPEVRRYFEQAGMCPERSSQRK
ncbi:hypothetical protein DC522_31515 [Microvirga sp. KLBC 81]|uniref:helix-turn-helix domain-containing protein n=1 Tax=Microvirga sp. KLBC 81 TaxID=1862707 RepID=UPI000D514B7D|nr:helix-turn-helix domain-containing protein [Microvirga sp. KLBC 81]PVE20585.1 hypothetical protein DC522_31515 [Microvirga sp. KLBC 81]